MKPIPVSFHVGPLVVHTYGIGLAVTFWFAYRYFEHRLRRQGYPTQWVTGVFLWVVVAAIVGARLVHVLSDLSYYGAHPGEIVAVWHGGLSSFGGLLLGVPTGILLARRRCPELSLWRALDLVAPVLMAAWGIGRLLGPQLMVSGGGARTSAWYGMYYAGEVGKRVPVPIIQSIDCFVIFGLLILIERRYRNRPTGFVLAAAAGLWGLSRFFEELVFLRQSSPQGALAVEITGLCLFAAGAGAMALLWHRQRRTAPQTNDVAQEPQDESVGEDTGAASPGAASPGTASTGTASTGTASTGAASPGAAPAEVPGLPPRGVADAST